MLRASAEMASCGLGRRCARQLETLLQAGQAAAFGSSPACAPPRRRRHSHAPSRTAPLRLALPMMLSLACSSRAHASSPAGAGAFADEYEQESYELAAADAMFDWSRSKADFDSLKPPSDSLQRSSIAIDEYAPNFSGDAVIDGEITELKAADYKGKWTVLFFYPKDFTFVCPTEIIAFSDSVKEFEKRNAAVIGASCDSAEVHLAWIRTPRKQGGLGTMKIPLLADVDRRVAAAYGALNRDHFPNRGIYLIDPEGKLKSMQINMNAVGRSVDEALRLLDAYQYVAEHGVVCPANWKPGEDTMEADPEGSLKYFANAEASQEDEADFGQTLTSITSKEQFEKVISGSKPVVVDFMASWCGKCRQLAPTVEQLQKDNPKLEFYKMDTSDDALEGLSSDLGIASLPVFKFYKNGKEIRDEVVGYKKKPLQQAVAEVAQGA